jgi:hypothetical protein
MTQTSPQPTERTTSRQRRIEEQRRKIDEARRQQRQKRLVQGGIAVGIALVAIVALFFLIPRGGSGDQMRQVPLEAANHVEEGAPLTYRNRPPSSGMHYGTVPQASEYRMYDQPLSPGRWVHMLEHGAVAVLYRPDLCDDACVATLGQVWDQAPRSNLVGGIRHLAITPYQNMDHPIAVVAWGYVDEMDQADKDRVLADIKSKMDAPSAPERGAL